MSKIDNIFKNKLAQKKEAHPEHIWKAIERELENESKRPMAWMFILSAIALFGLLMGYMTYTHSNDANETSSSQVADASSMQEGTLINQNESTLDGKSNSSEELNVNDSNTHRIDNNSTNDSKITKTSQQNNKEANTKNNNQKTKTSASNTKTFETSNLDNLQTESSKTNSNASLLNADSNLDGDANGTEDVNQSNEFGAPLLRSNNSNVNTDSKITTDQHATIKWKIEQRDDVKVNTISAPEIIKRKAFNRRRELQRAPFEIPSRFEIKQFEQSTDRLLSLTAAAGMMYIDCPTFSSDRTGMHLDLYVNHEMPFQSLSSNEATTLLDLRKMSESSVYSNSYGGRISLTLPSGLSLRTGFNFSQIKQSVSYADEKGLQLKSSNKHNLVEIPFILGYEFGSEGSRFYYAANGGVLLNVRYTQEGSVLNDGMVLVNVNQASDNETSIYKDTAGASLYGSFAVYYRWLQQFDLYLEPNFRVMTGNLSQDVYPLKEKYTSLGVMTGIRYRF